MIQKVRSPRRNRFVRGARDFLLGLGLFTVMLTAANHLPARTANEPAPIFNSSAYAAIQPATYSRPHGAATAIVSRASDDLRTKVILGLVFSTLVAFNLALLRHLRRVYASPR
jgi:hypothetical protein